MNAALTNPTPCNTITAATPGYYFLAISLGFQSIDPSIRNEDQDQDIGKRLLYSQPCRLGLAWLGYLLTDNGTKPTTLISHKKGLFRFSLSKQKKRRTISAAPTPPSYLQRHRRARLSPNIKQQVLPLQPRCALCGAAVVYPSTHFEDNVVVGPPLHLWRLHLFFCFFNPPADGEK